MTCICSDTNIWIDFEAIGKLDIPFRLPETFIMHDEAVRDELVFPEGLDRRLLAYGLVAVDITLSAPPFFGKTSKKQEKIIRQSFRYDTSAYPSHPSHFFRDFVLLSGVPSGMMSPSHAFCPKDRDAS